MRALRGINAALEWCLRLLCGVLGAFITLLMFTQVIMRYFGDEPLSWSEEVIRYSFMWCGFLGAALAQRGGWHVALELVDSYPAPLRRLLRVLGPLVMIGFLALIAVSGWRLTALSWAVQSVALEWPMSFAYACIPASAVAMIAFSLEALLRGEAPAA